ncbi:MAG: type IV pilus secretin PilQ [Candidatus Methylumidiphilus sp.]
MDTVTRQYSRISNGFWHFSWAVLLLLQLAGARAEPLKLLAVDFSTLPGDSLQVQLSLSGLASPPRVFHTDNPARIALDLPGVDNGLDKRPISVNVGNAETIQAIAASGRTRVVINLTELPPYSTRVEGNNIYVVLRKSKVAPSLEPPAQKLVSSARAGALPDRTLPDSGYEGGRGIRNIDFRRGDKGVGRIQITLGDPRMVADIREEGRKVIATFPNASLPPTLARRLDVMDFATPVQTIDSMEDGSGSKLIITPATDEYDYSSYQLDNNLTIEFRPLTKVEREEIKKKAFAYSGEKLSLNFQDIPVRSVLQILGDFTNLNIVASDTVGGNVTLRLNDVPWDQALDLVLKAKSLGKRQEGNIIQILPMEELNRQTREELEAQKTVEELEPLKTEIIQLNYTDVEAVKQVLNSTATAERELERQPGIGGANAVTQTTTAELSQSILSPRGSVTVDARTNQIIVKDTSRNLERIRELIKLLDVPVRQVLIESRIVIANNDFSRELGSRFAVNNNNGTRVTTIDGATTDIRTIPASGFMASGDALSDLGAGSAIAGPGGAIGFTVLKVGDYLLDLELSAAQREGRGEIVSNPRLLTSDKTPAIIKQGVQIPYQATVAVGGGGAVAISFKDALLELNVTPQITPDDNIRMKLIIKKDSKGEQVGTNFAIDKREINTTAQVANGDTVVLGGVYEGIKTSSVDKVPFLGDLPGLGFMFRHTTMVDQKKELLIFITPKIIRQNLGQR